MKKLLVALLCLSLAICCGCTGYREIERGYLVTAIGFKNQDSKIQIILETLSASNTESGSESIKVLSGEGKTFNDAYSDIKKSLEKTLYFEHCGVIAVSNDFTDSETKELFKFCRDLDTLNIDVYAVSTDDAKALFDMEAAHKSVGYSIIELIKNVGNGNIFNQLYNIEKQYASGLLPKLPVVNIKNDTLILE